MAKDKKRKSGDYDVGYGKPPKEHQFKKGISGNPGGAPPKPKPKPIDFAAVLNEPITVKNAGILERMDPFEVSVRQLVRGGLKQNNLNAVRKFLELCETYGLLTPPAANHGGGVIHAPKGVDFNEWFENVTELVPASMPDADDDNIN